MSWELELLRSPACGASGRSGEGMRPQYSGFYTRKIT